MDSKWFQLFEAEQKRRMDEEKRKQGTSISLVMIILVILAVVSAVSGADAVTVIFGILFPVLFIFGFVALLMRLGGKPNPIADLRLNLARLISTPEEIQLFDAEMLAEPKHTLQASDILQICFTEHYLYSIEKSMGLQKITLAAYDEIYSDRCSTAKSWVSTNPYRYHVFLDLYDDEHKRVLSLSIEDDCLETLDGLLKEYCPNYQMSQHCK